jgi:hypothetical protein
MADLTAFLAGWAEENELQLADQGVEIGFTARNARLGGRNASMYLDSGDRAVSGTLWQTGEFVLDYVDAPFHGFWTVEMCLAAPDELAMVLDSATRFVLGAAAEDLGRFNRYGLR